MAILTTGALPKLLAGTYINDPCLQVTSLHSIQQPHSAITKYRIELSDGVHTHSSLLSDKYKDLVIEEALQMGSIICLKKYSCKMLHNFTALLLDQFEILSNNSAIVGSPIQLLQATDYVQPLTSGDGIGCSQTAEFCVQNMAPFQPIPIKSLTPYHKHWSIEGRALEKTKIHEYKNASHGGKVFSFEFIDKDSSEIHVSCFNEHVDHFYDIIQPGCLYKISSGRIKVSNTKYNSSTNPYEIDLLSSSTISPSTCPDSTIPKHSYHFKSIDSLDTYPLNSLVDVIGIIVSFTPSSTIRKRDGTETKKCTTTIKDMSNCTIDITLWGHLCEIEGKQILEMFEGQTPVVILFKAARLVSWNGKKLDSTFSTSIVINPNLSETSALQIWYTSIGKDNPFVPLSKGNTFPHRFENPIDICIIANQRFPTSQPICVKATITKLHLDNFYYLSCPLIMDNKKCKKKIVRSSSNKFWCPKCSTELSNCAYSYILKMDLEDDTGELIKVTAFEGPSTTLLGVPAEDFQLLLADPDAAKTILENVIDRQFLFELSTKMNHFAGGESQSIIITALKVV